MMKKKYNFICQNCNQDYIKWQGQCYGCKSFDTIIEMMSSPKNKHINHAAIKSMSEVDCNDTYYRILTGIRELDTVLGGGILNDSVILLSGNPGIGKSTLLLEIVCSISEHKKILYITTEESESQIKLRLLRLQKQNQNWYICQETNFEAILDVITSFRSEVVIIDSLQNITINEESPTCHIQQIKTILHTLVEHAKKNHYIIFITGHVTKDGAIAGPKSLEHLVDVVLYLEILEDSPVRILRTTKNRFGSTNEVGFFTMTENGMNEYKNPQEIFIENNMPAIGSALTWISEGSRSFLIEIQTLINKTRNNTPVRVTHGVDNKQFILLCAVIEKYLKIPLYEYDIFSKIAHNYKIKMPHIDLAIVMSILSSYYNQKISKRTFYHGEVCLSGKINSKYGITEKLSLSKYSIERAIIPTNIEYNLLDSGAIISIDSIYHVIKLFDILK